MLSPGFFKTQGSWGWRCHCPSFPFYIDWSWSRGSRLGIKRRNLFSATEDLGLCIVAYTQKGLDTHSIQQISATALGWSQSTCFRQRFPCQLPDKPSALTNLHVSQMFNFFGHCLTELSYNWVPGGSSLSGDVYPSLSVKTVYNSDFTSLSANKTPEVSPSTLLLNSKTV